MDKWLWEHKENALDVACYPLWGSLREPQTTAVVTFIRQCLPAGNTHTHQHIHSTASTHWVMMGLSSPITACSSRLRSRAQSVKMDSSQEVLGPWILYFKPQKGLLQSLKTLNYLSSFPDTSLVMFRAELSVLEIYFLDILWSVEWLLYGSNRKKTRG